MAEVLLDRIGWRGNSPFFVLLVLVFVGEVIQDELVFGLFVVQFRESEEHVRSMLRVIGESVQESLEFIDRAASQRAFFHALRFDFGLEVVFDNGAA